jgi:pimeloyl-ACP methyl ester carboxylesterase
MIRWLVLLFGGLLQAGCTSIERDAVADGLARQARLERSLVGTETFVLTVFSRIADPAVPLVVYIEGDGLAWKSRSEPSLNPTPRDPVGLKLAALDGAPNVLYVARPCQYTPQNQDWNCRAEIWTSHRFSEPVIRSVSQAIDSVRARNGITAGVHLVGYSGGGAVAALIAARRSDVLSLRTVAGNLDHDALNRLHGVSLMPHSLNAADVAANLAHLPQRHLVGGRDTIVPRSVIDSYVRKIGSDRCGTVIVIDGVSHENGWESAWRQQGGVLPTCSP